MWLGWVFVWILHFIVWFKCTWAVANYLRKYLHTSLDVNNVRDWNKPLSMASIHVNDTGMNTTECRYCISYDIDDFWYALLLCYSCDGIGEALEWEMRRIFHNTFILSLGPWMNILLFSFIVTCCDLNTAVNTASHRLTIETSELCERLGKMRTSRFIWLNGLASWVSQMNGWSHFCW